MILYKPDGTTLADIKVDDNSYRYRAIMGDNTLTLYFSLPLHLEIPIGAYTEFQGVRYTLVRPEALKMKHSRYFEYTVTMDGAEAKAKRWKFRNPVDGRLKFPLTATPLEHLQMFVDNMNGRDSGWSVGSCIEGVEQLISYNHNYCLEALQLMAQQFDTEYEISGKVVSLKKVEYNKSNPLALSYGKGNGFKSGVGRSNSGDSLPVEILYVQGGTENINPTTYGSQELVLPKGQTLGYDGNVFSDQSGYVSGNGRTYVASQDGLSLQRSDRALDSYAEDSLDCSTICPKRVGTISSVVVVDAENNFYDIVDSSIPAALNYNNYLISGETMTVVFQSGMLAGREFEAKYIHEPILNRQGEVVKAGRRFEIVPQDIDGQTMPNNTFKPVAGNSYAVFHCALPEAYIRDDSTKTGASWDMFREAIRYMYSHEEQQFTFKGELDGIWAKQDWVNIGGKLVLGGYISFSDVRFQPQGVLVRIVGIKDYINNPHSPTIELSNQTITGGFSSTLKELENEEVSTDHKISEAVSFTKRRYRDAKETISALKESLLDFSEGINPITVQTMAMLVGDESLQFRYVDSRVNPQLVNHTVSFNQTTKILTCSAGILQHMTLGIDTLSPSHAASEYKFWDMSAFTSAYLGDDLASKKYYLYAKVSKTAQTGVFVISENAIAMDSVSGYYHLLEGVLNSEFEGTRSYVSLYGYTEVLPGRITTDKIVSPDGLSYFDMLANAARLGAGSNSPYIEWNKNGDGKMRIHGAISVDGGGAESPQLVDRGAYSAQTVYYWGDFVTYQGSTYLNIYELGPTTNILPTDTSRWRLWVSKGDTGVAQFKSIVFKRTNSTPATPSGGSYQSPVPSGWSDGVPFGEAQLWMSTNVFCSDGTASGWTTPRAATDTADIDFEYSAVETNPGTPTSSPANWHNTATASDIWMAVRKCSNGEWGSWEVNKIKGEKGADAEPVRVQYSADGTNWHDSYQSGDVYMRVYSQGAWGSAVKIKGETGPTGADGSKAPYHDFTFGISAYTSASGAPTDVTSWTDTPPATTSAKPFLWCRDRYYTVNSSNNWVLSATSYYRLTGEAGAQGKSISVQWSVDGSSWHNSYQAGDKYMRERVGTDSWSAAIKVVGENGADGQDGADGVDGVSILWQGSFASHPSNPQNGWAYYNTTDKKSYTYRSGSWYQMTKDGVDGANGQNGADGLSITWKGDSSNPPANPQKNWAYRDTDNGYCYIYNGTAWVLMVHDGSDGEDGTDGADGNDGLSVFITYHDNPASSTPSTPTGAGTSGGWHTNPTNASVWMSQKVASSSSAGSWGSPIRIKGTDGADGQDGTNGSYTSFVFKNAWNKPSTPTGTNPVPSGWSDSPDSSDIGLPTFEGSWAVNGNVITSNTISHSQQTWEKIKFTTNKANSTVKIKIAAYSENNYDWGYICNLDSAYSTSSYLKRVSGTNQDTAIINVATAGDHYIYVGYTKDGSTSTAPDQIVVEIITNQIWMSKCSVQDGVASGEWTTPVLLTGANGINGNDGTNGNLTKHQWAITLTTTQPAEGAWKNSFAEVASHSGYYLWQRLLESTDGGVTWTVNSATVGIILDPTVTKEEAQAAEALNEAARQTTAEKLGYSSWSEFESIVAASSVLIQNGMINAALINTDLLIAKVVKTAMARRRIEIDQNEMEIIDDDEQTSVRMHGGYHSSIYSFASISGGQTSVNPMPTSYTGSQSETNSETGSGISSLTVVVDEYDPETEEERYLYTGNSFTITNDGISKVTGRLRAVLSNELSNIQGFDSYSLGWQSVQVSFYLSTSSSVPTNMQYLGSAYASQSGSTIYQTKYLDFSIKLEARTYYVWMMVGGESTIINQGSYSYQQRTYSAQLRVQCTAVQNTIGTVTQIAEKLEVFANGIGYRQTNNDYGVLLRTGSSKAASGNIEAEIRSGYAGFKMTNNNIQVMQGNSYISLMPKLMIKAKWNTGSSTWTLMTSYVRNYTGSNNCTIINTGDQINVNLPSDCTTLTFSEYDIMIGTANGNAATDTKTLQIYRVSNTQLRLAIWGRYGSGEYVKCNFSLIVYGNY